MAQLPDLNKSLTEKYAENNKAKIPTKRNKITTSIFTQIEVPSNSYKDLAGIDDILQEIHDLVEMPFLKPELYAHLGALPPRGILLHGPPGCGKSTLVSCIAGELNLPLAKISAPELVSGMSGESETKIRALFKEAMNISPCILFIDEIDSIATKRDSSQKDMGRRIVAQLLTCMDDLNNHKNFIMVIGATNRPDSLDAALRRAGRFDREIQIGIPNLQARKDILTSIISNLRINDTVDILSLASQTPGFVGADLKALTQEAAIAAVRRLSSTSPGFDISSSYIENIDFKYALRKIQPSAKREGFVEVPRTKWSDIGALDSIRRELQLSMVEPLKHSSLFESVGICAPAGILLWGPPGCGKTLLGKAVASESHSNFISVKGPELLNKYVGETERAIRNLFIRAKQASPCVIFFDEIDSICPKRNNDSSDSSSRIVNQFLTEMDGLEDRKQVFIMAASNRPDMIDSAILRPGRFDKLLFVGIPTAEERAEILKTLSKKTPLSADVDFSMISQDSRCQRMTGADLSSLIREASLNAVKISLYNNNFCEKSEKILVTASDFNTALETIKPSVSEADLERYSFLNHRKNF